LCLDNKGVAPKKKKKEELMRANKPDPSLVSYLALYIRLEII
jgi:hypothetical protein